MIHDNEVKILFNNILCCFSWKEKYDKKKNNLRESGYIVDKPIDYKNNLYGSIKTHGFWDVKVYYKYGVTYHLEDDDTYTISNRAFQLPEALKQHQKRRKKRRSKI